MARANLFTTILILMTLYVCTLLEVTSASAPVYGLNATDKRDDDFLIMLKRRPGMASNERWQQIKEYVENLESHPIVSAVYVIDDIIVMSVQRCKRVLNIIQQHEEIELIQVNYVVSMRKDDTGSTSGDHCINQASGSDLWGLGRTSVRAKPKYSKSTYEYQEGDGEGVDVYVVDSGIYIEHKDFEGRASHGFTAALIMEEGSNDLNGHGTHVAGTVAGKQYGIAKKAHVIAVKVLDRDGSGTSRSLIEGLQWVLNHYKAQSNSRKGIANLSLGVASGEIDLLLEEIVLELVDSGMPVVIAAGNSNSDACKESPARMSAAITVGSTTRNDALASFSNYGSCVDILAPGTDILSAGISSTSSSSKLQGTSMSAPHVAGVAARFLSQMASIVTPSQLKSWLLDTATSDVINLRGHIDTPNKLLYMACIGAQSNCIVYSLQTSSKTGSDDGKSTLMIVMVVGFAALVVISVVSLVLLAMIFPNRNKKGQGKNSQRTYNQINPPVSTVDDASNDRI